MNAYPAGMVPKRAHLYVGNLSPRVTEYMLTEIFAVAGPVQHVKIIPDRTYQHGGLNYGFVEYMDMRAAETALQTLNGRKIFDTEIRVNWAYQGTTNKEDTTNHCHVFVGDLSPEVTDEVLSKAFAAFGTLSDARVMWDMNSGKSRGYGFLAFRDKTDAEQAIATMNGEWLGSRAIRVNWANQKTGGMGGMGGGMPGMPTMPSMAAMSAMPPMPSMGGMASPMGGMASPMGGMARPGGTPTTMNPGLPYLQMGMTPAAPQVSPLAMPGAAGMYETVLSQAPPHNTTVYVGNLPSFATQQDLIPLFQTIGYVSEIRIQPDRGFAFVKLESHEAAAAAIVQLQGQPVQGRPIKCSWGKDRAAGDTSTPVASLTPTGTSSPYSAMPMYGLPSPTSYPAGFNQYYPGFTAGNAGATGAAPAAGTASPGGDPAAANWGANYSYWGGYYNQAGQGGQAEGAAQ